MDPWKWPNLYVTQSGAAPFIRAMCPIISWLIGIHFSEYMTVSPQSNYSVEKQWRNEMNQGLTFTSLKIILSLALDFHTGSENSTRKGINTVEDIKCSTKPPSHRCRRVCIPLFQWAWLHIAVHLSLFISRFYLLPEVLRYAVQKISQAGGSGAAPERDCG